MNNSGKNELNNQIKVSIISPGLPIPPTKGGAIETGIYESCKHLRKVNVDVISEDLHPEKMGGFNTANVTYCQLKQSSEIPAVKELLCKLAKWGFFSLFNYSFIKKAANFLSRNPPDIINVRNNFYYIPYLKRQIPQGQIILQMHNDFLFEHLSQRSKYVNVLRKVDLIITVSDYIRRRILRYCPECENKIVVVHNGVSLDRFQQLSPDNRVLAEWRNRLKIGSRERVIIFVGRICADKGTHILIDAFRKIAKACPDVKLLVVGSSWFADGKLTPYLKKIYDMSSDLRGKIIFAGFVPHDSLGFLYNLSSVCVVPSIFDEPFGLVNLEAMASGCPVVASRVGGIPEIIKDNETGLLVNPNDADDLFEKIRHLLDDETMRLNLVRNASDYVKKNCDWSFVAQRYESLYLKLFETRRNGKN